MNVKQTLMLAGGLAILALFAYVTGSGHGIQGTEFIPIGIGGGAIAAAMLGLMYAFRDQ